MNEENKIEQEDELLKEDEIVQEEKDFVDKKEEKVSALIKLLLGQEPKVAMKEEVAQITFNVELPADVA